MQCFWDHPIFGKNPSKCCNQGLIKRCYKATTWRAKNVPYELMRARESQWEPRRPKLASECHWESQLEPERARERVQVRQRASQREPERSREPERALVCKLEPEEAREMERIRKSQKKKVWDKSLRLSGSLWLSLDLCGSHWLSLPISGSFG